MKKTSLLIFIMLTVIVLSISASAQEDSDCASKSRPLFISYKNTFPSGSSLVMPDGVAGPRLRAKLSAECEYVCKVNCFSLLENFNMETKLLYDDPESKTGLRGILDYEATADCVCYSRSDVRRPPRLVEPKEVYGPPIPPSKLKPTPPVTVPTPPPKKSWWKRFIDLITGRKITAGSGEDVSVRTAASRKDTDDDFTEEVCGDGFTEGNEECDGDDLECPENHQCSSDCRCIPIPRCGDFKKTEGEECDTITSLAGLPIHGDNFCPEPKRCENCKCVLEPSVATTTTPFYEPIPAYITEPPAPATTRTRQPRQMSRLSQQQPTGPTMIGAQPLVTGPRQIKYREVGPEAYEQVQQSYITMPSYPSIQPAQPVYQPISAYQPAPAMTPSSPEDISIRTTTSTTSGGSLIDTDLPVGECSPLGATKCGGGYFFKCLYDGWYQTRCGPNQICDPKEGCKEKPECNEGDSHCTISNSVITCIQGKWRGPMQCPEDCKDGRCVPRELRTTTTQPTGIISQPAPITPTTPTTPTTTSGGGSLISPQPAPVVQPAGACIDLKVTRADQYYVHVQSSTPIQTPAGSYALNGRTSTKNICSTGQTMVSAIGKTFRACTTGSLYSSSVAVGGYILGMSESQIAQAAKPALGSDCKDPVPVVSQQPIGIISQPTACPLGQVMVYSGTSPHCEQATTSGGLIIVDGGGGSGTGSGQDVFGYVISPLTGRFVESPRQKKPAFVCYSVD